jgi:hypothetical protein
MVLKVEVGGGTSKLIRWKLCWKLDQGLKWQMDGVDEQSYAIHV